MSTLGQEQSIVSFPAGLWSDRPQNWISALPNELLMETFKLAVQESHDSKSLAPEFPTQYTLTAVCRQWRYFVLDAKSLWTTIYLGPHASNLFFNFFEKSRQAYLDIIVVLDFSTDAMSDALVDRIATTLVLHVDRTRSLRIQLFEHYDLFENFFQDWLHTSKPCLSHLQVTSGRTVEPASFRDLADPVPPPSVFSSLKTLVLQNTHLHTVPSIPGLTTLDFRSERRTSVTVGKIVQHFPSVTRLIIRQLRVTPDDNPPDDDRIIAVNIKELILHLNDDDAGNDVCRIELPNLKYLEILGHKGTSNIMKHICTSKLLHLKKIRLCMMTCHAKFSDIVSALQELESSIELEVAETYFTYFPIKICAALFNLPVISSFTLIGIKTPVIVESVDLWFQKLGLSTLPFPVYLQGSREEWLSTNPKLRKRLKKTFGDLLTLQFPHINEGFLEHQYCSAVFHSKSRMGLSHDSEGEASSDDTDEGETTHSQGEDSDVDTDDDNSSDDFTDEEALREIHEQSDREEEESEEEADS